MKERPLLFNGEMIRALLNTKVGTWPAEPIDPSKPFKWQTRRPIKANISHSEGNDDKWYDADCVNPGVEIHCPWERGDQLWARETFFYRWMKAVIIYRADIPDSAEASVVGARYGGWKPSIFLPRRFSRIQLEVMTQPIPERVSAISERDAKAEGVTLHPGKPYAGDPHRCEFRSLWDSIHGQYPSSFLQGPWVWKLSFKRIK